MLRKKIGAKKCHPRKAPKRCAQLQNGQMRKYMYCVLLGSVLLTSCNPSEKFDYDRVHFEQEDIYIKKINWGITGDAQKTAISTSKRNIFDDQESDYTYNGLTELFYKTSGDTLLLYVRDEFKRPGRWDSDIIVKQIVLDNPQFMHLFDEERNCSGPNCIKGF